VVKKPGIVWLQGVHKDLNDMVFVDQKVAEKVPMKVMKSEAIAG